MMLCLRGRLETRLFLLLVIALPGSLAWMALHPAAGTDVATSLRSGATIVLVMGTLGMAWECLYHGLQQLRWDRDWPSLFALVCIAVEIGPLWLTLRAMPGPAADVAATSGFGFLVLTVWVLMWLFAQGPMRVLFIRWRLTGGRLL